MSDLTIGAVAHLSGVRPSALRYYERVGVLPPARRVHGQRRYDPVAVERVAQIKLAQRAGFTIAEIARLAEAVSEGEPLSLLWDSMGRRKLREIEEELARLQESKRLLELGGECHCERLSECSLVQSAG